MPSKQTRQKIPPSSNSVVSAAQVIHTSHDHPPSRTNEDTGKPQPAPEPPTNWPSAVKYLSRPIQSPYLTNQQKRWLHHKPQPVVETNEAALPLIKLPLSRTQIDSTIEIKFINDENHPAHGQGGLFAANSLAPGALIVPYIGYVHSSIASEKAVRDTPEQPEHTHTHPHTEDTQTHDADISPSQNDRSAHSHHTAGPITIEIDIAIGSWDTSSYDLNLHRDGAIELAVDAAQMGNEARFCNDYRGVPAQTNPNTSTANTNWDRQQKRSAKSWSSSSGTGEGFAKPTAMAIPNAEFRDVWFEWAGDGDTIDVKHDGRTEPDAENEDGLAGSSVTENGPETKQARRKRRRKNVGMRGVAIFVMPAGKAGKRKEGIKAGQEILVSYGKGFWSHHGVESPDVSRTEFHQVETA
ncbi:hypothetical protein LTR70_001740 [Exophiala xenobiotica]|uniref:SET domain-containing protein n=1 Tax=Lithohypha guttulata TaxID=1690604 RepID=A0ABR0KP58_9EURO|nr:hypothetical protein LTR24_001067 [Lithohypha guttulata]KAK5326998.1 hypothetical protein LTR70_001740 [Exophiala xenobiotica]